MAIRFGPPLKRLLIFVHRWLGVALSVIFLLWFVSGIVMMYWRFPGVTAQDRLQRAPVLAPERITVSPETAAAALGDNVRPSQLRLTSYDGRPVYTLGGGGRGGGPRRSRGGPAPMVFADDGLAPPPVDAAFVERAAAAWVGQPVTRASKETVEEVDQWTIEGGLRSQLPLEKYSWPDGQQVYLNPGTGVVVQYTTTSSRFWAYLGAIPHWLYFTPLRKHQQEWFALVVWSSLIGTVAALLGIVIAVWMYSPKKRYRHAGAPTSIPYRGWKRWHTITGLGFGVVTATWAFSGLLSMGPFPIMDRLTELTVPSEPRNQSARPAGEPQADGAAAGRRRGGPGGGRDSIAAALTGRQPLQFEDYAAKSPAVALTSVRDFGARELEHISFNGEPAYLVTNVRGETRIVPVRGEPKDSFDTEQVVALVKQTAGSQLAELRVIDQYDAYYLDRLRERPLPVVYAKMNDAVGTRYYIDPKTARVVATYSARGWVNRWLYHGLHSLDFPWLYNYRPLWDIVVITLMLGGTAVCVTSIVLTWRVLVRKVAALVRAHFTAPSEDLTLEAGRS